MSTDEPQQLSRERYLTLIEGLRTMPPTVAPKEFPGLVARFEGVATPNEHQLFDMPNPPRAGYITTTGTQLNNVTISTTPRAALNAPMLVDAYADQLEWTIEALGQPASRTNRKFPLTKWHMDNGDLNLLQGMEVRLSWTSTYGLELFRDAAQVSDDELA